jgi:hypothetical protein
MTECQCHICKGKATLHDRLGDFEHLACAVCGEYKITDTAIQMVKNKIDEGRRVEVPATRKWLTKQRQGSTDVPKIESINMLYY